MEGYDNMDNNNSSIPNVSDIKFDDTPAESFDSLYGGSSQQPVNSTNITQGPSMVPNPGMAPGMSQGPSVASNSGMAPGMSQGPSVAPNPGMAPSMNQGPSVVPTPGMAPGMSQGPSVAPTPGMAPGMSQGPSVVPTPGMAPSMNQGPSVAPTPGTINQAPVEDLSDMEIDAEKMQSIEEQLSKTSQYNPADFQQEKIVIQTDDQYEKNKSGLTFLIVLFAILGLAIILIPQITKFIK